MSVLGRVVNTDHQDNTLSIIEGVPELTYTFVRSDVGSASWIVPFSHPQLYRLTSDGPQGFGPKLTDFRVGISRDNGNTWETKFAGICGPVGLDSEKDSVSVAGVDWLAWLDQPYRFGAYTGAGRTAADVVKFWSNQDQQTIIGDLVASLWNGNALESVHITTAFEGSGWTSTIPATFIVLGDNVNVLDHIKTAGAYNEPYGFEFWMGWDKVLTFSAPRRVNVESDPIYRFAPSLENIVKLTWGNTGPKAITTEGEIFGGLRYNDTYDPSVQVYRDWWQIVAFNSGLKMKDITSGDLQGLIERVTRAVGTHDRNPQKQPVLTIQPDAFGPDPDWFSNLVGNIISIDSEDWFLPYHRIDASYWIQQQTLKSDEVGNWTCELTLEQIYNNDPLTD